MSLRVGIIGCGLIGAKRAEVLGPDDEVVAVMDRDLPRAQELGERLGCSVAGDVDELLGQRPDVVIVATTHDALAPIAQAALRAGSHVLVEKPAGRTPGEVDAIADAARSAGRLVKVGFNHRFYPGIQAAVADARSGAYGPIMFVRARYGHGGRVGYEHEWRAQPEISGGGELMDQGMHLLDLVHWLLGPLPLHDALLRTSYWDMAVEDNAVVTVADRSDDPRGPWATFHVSWSEWKNLFDLEIYATAAKWHIQGLAKSYGPQTLRVFRMRPEMGPPDVDEHPSAEGDGSWAAEWAHFRERIMEADGGDLLGDLASAAYAHEVIGEAYRRSGYPAPPRHTHATGAPAA